MIRDIRCKQDYWDECINFELKDIEDNKDLIEGIRTKRPGYSDDDSGCISRIMRIYNVLPFYCYSRGDSIHSLKQYFEFMLSYGEQYEVALDKNKINEENRWYGDAWSVNLGTYIMDFWWIGLALALEIPDDQWQRLLKLIGNEGEDELLDRIIATRQKDRKIGTKLCHPKPYQLLLDAINAPKEQQAQKLFYFVDNWYKQLGDKKRPYLPKGMPKIPSWHNSADSGSYFGYWCIEAVAAVKAFNLDDSLCLGHENYPGDLLRPDGPTTHKTGIVPKCDQELLEQEKTLQAFLAAVEAGDMAAVANFIQAGMDVNAEDNNGRSALLLACIKENNPMAIKLLEYGADANLDNTNQYSALTHVINYANQELLKKMLEAGANPNEVDEGGNTPLMLAASGTSASCCDMIKILVDHGAQVNQSGYSTPLIEAAKADSLENVKLLIKLGANLNKKTQEEGNTALIFAAGLGHVVIVKELIKAGADLDIKNKYGDTALQIVNQILDIGYYDTDESDDMNIGLSSDSHNEINQILLKHNGA